MLPTFIVVGAMKCGTSSLYRYLGAHPEISISRVKETDFFLEGNKKSLSWYESLFEENIAAGEVSPNYSKYPSFENVPYNISNTLDNVKIIYIVRDPIERLISHYVHNLAVGREYEDINRKIQNKGLSHYINCSKYNMQIKKYMDYFSSGNIKVITSRELRSETYKTMGNLFGFIGVSEGFKSETYDREYHKSSNKRSAPSTVERMRKVVSDFLASGAVREHIPDILVGGIKDTYSFLFESPIERPSLSRESKEEIARRLSDDIDRFRSYTGRSLSWWSV